MNLEKAAFLPVAARREGRVAGDAERLMDGILIGHHERTGTSLFLSERGLLRGMSVSGKPQTINGTMNSSESVEEEPEVRPPPVPAVIMPIHEALVRTPEQKAQIPSETGYGAVWTDARM